MRISLTGGDWLAVEERKGEGEERTRGLQRKLGPELARRIRGLGRATGQERGGSLGRGEKEKGRGFPLGPEQEEEWAFGPELRKGEVFLFFFFIFLFQKVFKTHFKILFKSV